MFSNIIKNLQQHIFNSVVSTNLIYNTCWEDPRIDRHLLQLDSNSNILMLTSGGCNALDYLLDEVPLIHSVDINPAQNALLDLKKALFINGNYQLLWKFFGNGKVSNANHIYKKQLRTLIPFHSRRYWDNNITNFEPQSGLSGFYFSGTSGKIAMMVNRQIKRKGLRDTVQRMLNANSIEEQSYYFKDIESQLWTPFARWLVRRHATMTMLGVPKSQRKLIEKRYQKGLPEFIRKSLRHVFTELSLTDNYFWRVYLTGHYSPECCPNYLLESNFDSISQRVEHITTYTSSLQSFLENTPNEYSHFILLDHQDWMAYAQPNKLAAEWNEILNHAKPGARILFRSAGRELDFLPNFIFDSLSFKKGLTQELHPKDRVGTYESTHLAVVE